MAAICYGPNFLLKYLIVNSINNGWSKILRVLLACHLCPPLYKKGRANRWFRLKFINIRASSRINHEPSNGAKVTWCGKGSHLSRKNHLALLFVSTRPNVIKINYQYHTVLCMDFICMPINRDKCWPIHFCYIICYFKNDYGTLNSPNSTLQFRLYCALLSARSVKVMNNTAH